MNIISIDFNHEINYQNNFNCLAFDLMPIENTMYEKKIQNRIELCNEKTMLMVHRIISLVAKL